MDGRAAESWVAQQFGLRIAEVAISTLERGGVRCLPVKGLLLGRQVYDPALRRISDVDLLIARSDFRRALAIARTSGWGLIWDSKLTESVNFIIEGFAIDVKTSLGPRGVSAITVPDVLSRARRAQSPLGFSHWQIELHDHALLLAIDAFKDKLGAGKPWARDDLVRIGAVQGFSPATLVERAIDARLATMLAIVAEWVLAASPSPTWMSVHALLASLPLRLGFVQRYQRSVGSRSSPRWQRWYLSALTRAVSDSKRQRVLALVLGAVGTAKYLARHRGLGTDPWRVISRRARIAFL